MPYADPMPRTPRKPKPQSYENLRAYADRPPGKRDARWYWRVRVEDTSESVWTGRATPSGIGDILRELVRKGENHPAGKPRAEECRTLDDLLDFYIGELSGRADINEPTLVLYRSMRRAINRGIGRTLVEQLNYRVLAGYLRARAVSTRTKTMERDLIRRALTWGTSVGLIPPTAQPVRFPEIVVVATRAKVTPTEAQLAAVLEQSSGWMRLFLLLSWSTGARQQEIATLTWDKVDLEEGSLTVFGKRSKKNKQPWRTVWLSDHIVEELRAWKEQRHDRHDYVLGLQPGSVSPTLCRQLPVLCQAAGVPAFTNHGIRRAVVNRMARDRVDVSVAASITGHSPQVMLGIYRQVSEDERKAVRLGPPAGRVIDVEFG